MNCLPGPRALAGPMDALWTKIITWASLIDPRDGSSLVALKHLILSHDSLNLANRQAQASLIRSDLAPAIWHSEYGRHWLAWTAKQSLRRWLQTDGQEWIVLQASESYTAAIHVLKLLGGGMRTPAFTRSSAARAAFPRRCAGCGCADPEFSWITPNEHQPEGFAICRPCAPVNGHPAPFEATLLESPWRSESSHYGPCPLCGTGEEGAEHLLIWCPSVRNAWRHFSQGSSLSQAVANGGAPSPSRLAIFLHHVSFLNHTLQGLPPLSELEGSARLGRMLAQYTHRRGHSDDYLHAEDEWVPSEEVRSSTPYLRMNSPCQFCPRPASAVENGVLTNGALGISAASANPPDTPLLCLYGTDLAGLWPPQMSRRCVLPVFRHPKKRTPRGSCPRARTVAGTLTPSQAPCICGMDKAFASALARQ